MTSAPYQMSGKIYPKKWWAFMAVGLGVFMSTLDMSIINVSLPTMVQELHTDFATVQWIILSYALVITSAMLGVARLGDMFNKKVLYGAGLVLFTASSFLCGCSPTVHWLIGFRATQGIGAVMAQAVGPAILTEVFPPQERGKAFGAMGSIVSIGLVLGPPLGGLIIGFSGWPWIFWVNIPVGILAVWAVIRYVPELPPVKRGQRFDYPGSVTLFVALTFYALGMTYGQIGGFGQRLVWTLLGVAVAGMAAFVFSVLRAPEPLVDFALFRNILLSINLSMGFLIFVMLAGFFIMPFYLSLVKGYKPEQVGLLMIVGPLCMGTIAPIAGSLSDRFGPRLITLIGLIVIIAGCWTITTLDAQTTAAGYMLRLAPLGIGLGLFASPNMSAIMGAAPRSRLGVVSGLVALSRTLGQTTGVPLMGAIFTFFVLSGMGDAAGIDQVTSAGAERLIRGIRYTFGLAEVGVSLSTVLALFAMVVDSRRKSAAPSVEKLQG